MIVVGYQRRRLLNLRNRDLREFVLIDIDWIVVKSGCIFGKFQVSVCKFVELNVPNEVLVFGIGLGKEFIVLESILTNVQGGDRFSLCLPAEFVVHDVRIDLRPLQRRQRNRTA